MSELVLFFLRAIATREGERTVAVPLTVPLRSSICTSFRFADTLNGDALRFSGHDLIRDGDERRFRFAGDEFNDRLVDREREVLLFFFSLLSFSSCSCCWDRVRRGGRELEENGRLVVLEELVRGPKVNLPRLLGFECWV